MSTQYQRAEHSLNFNNYSGFKSKVYLTDVKPMNCRQKKTGKLLLHEGADSDY